MLPTVDITYRCVPEGPLPRAKCCILTLLNTQADCSVPLQLEMCVTLMVVMPRHEHHAMCETKRREWWQICFRYFIISSPSSAKESD